MHTQYTQNHIAGNDLVQIEQKEFLTYRKIMHTQNHITGNDLVQIK